MWMTIATRKFWRDSNTRRAMQSFGAMQFVIGFIAFPGLQINRAEWEIIPIASRLNQCSLGATRLSMPIRGRALRGEEEFSALRLLKVALRSFVSTGLQDRTRW